MNEWAFPTIMWNGNYPDRVWMWMYNSSLPIWSRNVSYSTCECHAFKETDKRSSNYISFSPKSHSELLWRRKSWSAHFQNATVRNMKRNSCLISKLHNRICGICGLGALRYLWVGRQQQIVFWSLFLSPLLNFSKWCLTKSGCTMRTLAMSQLQ